MELLTLENLFTLLMLVLLQAVLGLGVHLRVTEALEDLEQRPALVVAHLPGGAGDAGRGLLPRHHLV